jgi:hypothetical protein
VTVTWYSHLCRFDWPWPILPITLYRHLHPSPCHTCKTELFWWRDTAALWHRLARVLTPSMERTNLSWLSDRYKWNCGRLAVFAFSEHVQCSPKHTSIAWALTYIRTGSLVVNGIYQAKHRLNLSIIAANE